MLGWLICRFKGHQRGKRVETVTHADLTIEATMQCPRCKAKWVRKEKKRQAPLVLATPPAAGTKAA